MVTATANVSSNKVNVKVGDEVLVRSIRRVRKLENGMSVGWVSVGGKDTKVTKKARARFWTPVA